MTDRRTLEHDAEILALVPADERPRVAALLRRPSEVTPNDWQLYAVAEEARQRHKRGRPLYAVVAELAREYGFKEKTVWRAVDRKHDNVNKIGRSKVRFFRVLTR